MNLAVMYDLVLHLTRQKQWSRDTFGPGPRTAGVLDHIRKEMVEIQESGGQDLEEWIDIVLLAFDGAWRAGFTPAQIARALGEKQRKNEQRKWPDWRTMPEGAAIEHLPDDPVD